jgi:hypothetical protein
MSDDNLYYSKSKDKYIKIAEMSDQHVRYAFIKMNSEKMNSYDIESTLIKIRDDIQNLLDEIFEARKVDEAD